MGFGHLNVDPSLLNQETTQQQILEKICDLAQSENGWHEVGEDIAETGVDKTVFTSTPVPVGTDRWLNKIDVTCNRGGKFTILKDILDIGSGRLGGSTKNYPAIWIPGLKLFPGEIIIVKFKQFKGSDADIETQLHGIEK